LNPDLTSTPGAAATTVDSSKLPSFKNMSEQDLAVNYDLNASTKSDVPVFTIMRPILEKQTQVAFYDETLAKEFVPALEIVWIACPQAMWALERAKFLTERDCEEHARQNHKVRPIRFTEIEGANHLVSTLFIY
jgi:hypothetical protein